MSRDAIQSPSPTTSARRSGPTLLIESSSGFEPIQLKASNFIGRDRRNDIIIDHPTTSRQHARLWSDETGWHYQDLGSANGTKFGDAKLRTIIDLSDGMGLRIGRVQAYFFVDGIPATWKPPELGHTGKLLRCRCGHIGFAPRYTLGMTLHCAQCGRDLIHDDEPQANAARIAVDCAACHTTIDPNQRMHVCEECGAQMHYDCHLELGGCSTYGCSKVRHADHDDAGEATESAFDEITTGASAESVAASEEVRESIPFRFAQCGLMILAGLLTFGIPAIAFAAYRLVTVDRRMGPMRFVYSLLCFVGGAIGFFVSARLWINDSRLWRVW